MPTSDEGEIGDDLQLIKVGTGYPNSPR